MNALMRLIREQAPFRFPGLVKLLEFRNILTHKQQLLARMSHHISIGETKIGKFVLDHARHLPD